MRNIENKYVWNECGIFQEDNPPPVLERSDVAAAEESTVRPMYEEPPTLERSEVSNILRHRFKIY